MMRSFNGTNQYLYTQFQPTSTLTFPVTMSCWFVQKNTTLGRIITLTEPGGGVSLLSSITNYPSANIISNQYYGNNALPATSQSVTLNTLNHLMVTVNSTYNTIYLNGIKGANGAISGSVNIGYIYIGAFSGPNQYFYGDICDVAIWRGYGTADMAQKLYTGINPMRIRPHDLIEYYPLGSNGIVSDASLLTGKVLTAVNSPTWTNQLPKQQAPVTKKQRMFRPSVPPVPPVLKDYPIFKSPIANSICTNPMFQ